MSNRMPFLGGEGRGGGERDLRSIYVRTLYSFSPVFVLLALHTNSQKMFAVASRYASDSITPVVAVFTAETLDLVLARNKSLFS